jgi:hypothetical protein
VMDGILPCWYCKGGKPLSLSCTHAVMDAPSDEEPLKPYRTLAATSSGKAPLEATWPLSRVCMRKLDPRFISSCHLLSCRRTLGCRVLRYGHDSAENAVELMSALLQSHWTDYFTSEERALLTGTAHDIDWSEHRASAGEPPCI